MYKEFRNKVTNEIKLAKKNISKANLRELKVIQEKHGKLLIAQSDQGQTNQQI